MVSASTLSRRVAGLAACGAFVFLGACEKSTGQRAQIAPHQVAATAKHAVAGKDTNQTTYVNGRPLATVRHKLSWSTSAFLCRSEPGEPMHIMFTASGPAPNLRCNAVYDPPADRMFTFSGPVRFRTDDGWPVLDMADDETINVAITENFIRAVRGLPQYDGRMDRSRFAGPLCGWSSWHAYYQDWVNEKEIVRNARWVARHLKPFGAAVIQIDDGWQGVGRGGGENRDWEQINERFGGGMKRLADEIHELGLTAGLWIAPHGQSNPAFVQKHRDAFLWRADGTSVGEDAADPGDVNKYAWAGRYVVDSSTTGGQAYLRRLFDRLARDWGFDYFKIDGQPIVEQIYERHQARLGNPGMSAAEAYRAGLRVIREAIGPQRYLLGCWGTPRWGAGILNGARIGDDVWAGWEGLRPALRATWLNYWSHNIVWYTDPDAICVRPPLTLEQARVWASFLALTGQPVMMGDKMYELSDERVELLRRIIPPANIRPMDLYPRAQPDIICLKLDDAAGRRDIVGIFNWSAVERQQALDAAALGLPDADYLVYDVWRKDLLGRLDDTLTVHLPPMSCRVFCIRPMAPDRPTLLGTSRHLTQGAVDVENYVCGASRISGRSRLVGGDPYEVRFFVQPGSTPFLLTRPQADGAKAGLHVEGPVGVLTLTAAENTTVDWSLLYAIPGGRSGPRLQVPKLEARAAPELNAVRLSWSSVSSAAGYRIYRDGERIGYTPGTSWRDLRCGFGLDRVYKIGVVNWQGREAKQSEAVVVRLALATDRFLDELRPIAHWQDRGSLRFRQSHGGNALTLGDRVFPRGVGTYANSVLKYNLAGGYVRFRALVGVDDESWSGGVGTVVFKVLADGVLLFDSGVVRSGEQARVVDVDVSGRRTLELRVEDAGDGNHYDHADWAAARLSVEGAPATTEAESPAGNTR